MPRLSHYALAAALAAAAASTAISQNVAPLPATRPATSPATAPGVDVPEANATRPATQPATGDAAPISLDFKNVPLDAVLEYLSDAAGFVVVKDAPVDGRVTVVSRQPVTADEAVTLLNTVLKANGYTVVRNGRMLRIVGRDVAKRSNVPVHFGGDPEQIEAGDDFITQIIPIGNVDAVKLRQDLAPLLGSDADIAANGGSNAIVITDTSSNVKRVVQIIAALDRYEPGDAEIRKYNLKNADAASTAKLLLTLLRGDQPGYIQQQKPQTPEAMLRGRMNAVADDRTNTLFVTAQTDMLKTVDGIIKDLESNESVQAEIRTYSLKFADADAAAELIDDIFDPPELRGDSRDPVVRQAMESALKARVVAVADDRTNTLVVTAPSASQKIIEDLLKTLDADPASSTEIKIFPLNFADATAASLLISQVFKPAQIESSSSSSRTRELIQEALTAKVTAVADSRTNSLVVTAPPESIRIVEQILKVLDANPAANAAVRAFPLKHADATEAVYMLQTLFDADPATTTVTPSGRGEAAVPQITPAARGRMTAASDTRTNTIIVQAPAETLVAVEAVLKELDANPITEETLFIYRLKNGQSLRMEQVLNVLFGNIQPGSNNQFGRGGFGDPRLGGRLGGTSSRTGSRGGIGFDGFGGSNFGQQFGNFQQNDRDRDNRNQQNARGNLSQNSQRAVTELTGKVLVVADEDTNSLLITTATKYQEQVRQIVAELDRPAPQVLIKVLVAEVTHDRNADFGVDFSVINRRPNGEGTTVNGNFGNASQVSGLVVSLLEDKLNVTLRALATAGKLDVLSRPYILASDNQLASITVGNEVPFITNTRITDNGQQINTIEYQDVGIILNVVPHISPDGLVIMDVIPEISQLTGSLVPISDGVSAPVIAKRSASSRVGVRTGSTIVIGGLMEDRKTESISKIPLLGDIPILGQIFARTQINKTKTELLIFLTPHVAQEPPELDEMTGQELQGTKLTPKAVAPGMFEEHMKGMNAGEVPQTQPASQPRDPSVLEVPMRPTYRQPEPATQPAGQ